MSTTAEYIEFVAEQMRSLAQEGGIPFSAVRYRKMFGEYMLYADDKPIFLVCDNTVYVKMHAALRDLLFDAEVGVPYNGAKPHYILDVEDRPLCRAVSEILVQITPKPTPKKKKSIR